MQHLHPTTADLDQMPEEFGRDPKANFAADTQLTLGLAAASAGTPEMPL